MRWTSTKRFEKRKSCSLISCSNGTVSMDRSSRYNTPTYSWSLLLTRIPSRTFWSPRTIPKSLSFAKWLDTRSTWGKRHLQKIKSLKAGWIGFNHLFRFVGHGLLTGNAGHFRKIHGDMMHYAGLLCSKKRTTAFGRVSELFSILDFTESIPWPWPPSSISFRKFLLSI